MADLSTTKIYGDLTVSNNIKGYRIANLDDISVIYENRSITAGNGLSGGGALSNNLTISMGTPTGLTAGTADALTATSHTHSIATATAVGLSNASVSGAGTSTSLARADHTHSITGFSLDTHNHTGVYQPLDADLTSIAGLTGTTGLLRKTADNTWTLDTTGYTTNTGTVTSVGISVPTGLSVSGSPITTSGTIAISLTNGYSIPTTAVQTNWNTAYTDTNTATNSNTASKIVKRDGSGNFSAGTITASLAGNATSANKVNKALSLKFDTDTAVEGTNLYTFNGSSAKTINIKGGTNVSIAKASGVITISATDTKYTSASFTHSGLTGTHNLTTDLTPVWGNITSKPTTVSGYGITDAMTTAHPANNFTSAEVTNLRAGKLDDGTTPWTNASNITSGTISSERLPAIAITSTYVKGTEAEHLALSSTTQEGDVVVRTDLKKNFIKNSGTTGTMADWTMLEAPGGAVLSVNGKTGTVSLGASDVEALASNHDASAVTSTKISNWDAAYTHVGTTHYAEPGIFSGGGTPALATGVIAAEIRSLIGAGTSSTVGTVTSVAVSVPTGLSVSGTPVTTSGTIAISLATGYAIPTTTKQGQWDTAYTHSQSSHPYLPLAGGTLTGNLVLPNTVKAAPAVGIIYKGSVPFIHNFSYGLNGNGVTPVGANVFVGENAGNLTMGSTATNATHASINSAVGYNSLSSNTIGFGNSALGYNSLNRNTTGDSNSAFGSYSLYNNTTGFSNSAVGYYSLSNNTTGNSNSALGYYSLYSNITGSSNLAVGNYSISNNTTGNSNSALGYYSLYNNKTGNYNTAIGDYSFASNIAGHANTAIGYIAGHTIGNGSPNTASNNSTYIGSHTRAYIVGGTNETVIGYNAIGHGSNTVTIGNSSITENYFTGNVNAGTFNGFALATASTKGVVDGTIASAIGTGTSLPTERYIYQGLPTINNAHNYTSATTIYAPTAGGASGAILIGAGTTSAPTWSTATLTSTTLKFAGAGIINSTGANALTLDSTTTGAVNVGTSANAKTITIGNTTGATTLALKAGTGTVSVTGNITLQNSTGTTGIIYKGSTPFIHDFNYGDNGTTTTAGRNTFVGIEAGNLTMGSDATQPGQASYNTGIGSGALRSNTIGHTNTAVGFDSLSSNSTGYSNTAVGRYSLTANTTGYDNTAVGFDSLVNNSTGHCNTAVGKYSLITNMTGYYNTAVGKYSLARNATGNNNTAIGYFSGHYPGGGIATSNSVYLGVYTRTVIPDATNEIVIGYDVTGHGSNTVTIGNSSITENYFTKNVNAGTFNNLALTSAATGFTIAGGTTSKILTVSGDAVINGGTHSGTNTGDQTVGDATLTLAAGTGVTLSATPSFTANATTDKTITITNSSPNVTTDISITHNATTVVVNSSDGTDGTINGANATEAGVVTNAAQTWAGVKTFNSAPVSANGYTTGSATMVYNSTSKTIDFVFV